MYAKCRHERKCIQNVCKRCMQNAGMKGNEYKMYTNDVCRMHTLEREKLYGE